MDENRDLHPVLEKYLLTKYDEVHHHFPLPCRTEADFYIPSEPMIIEVKIKTSPAKIGWAFGKALMYRGLMKNPDIKIGLSFYNDLKSTYRWYRWEEDQAELLRALSNSIGEEIKLFLITKHDGNMSVEKMVVKK